MELGVQSQANLRRADADQLAFVRLDASQLPNDVPQHVVVRGADVRDVIRDQVVYREDVRHFNVKRRLRLRVKVVELVNVELHLRIGHVQYCNR